MAFCKSWINVPHFSPEGLVLWVMDYAIQWQLACKSAPWGSAPWQMCKRRIFHNLQRVADTFAFSLLGLLLNLKHKLQRSRCQKHKNKKKEKRTRLHKVVLFILSALRSICSSLQGRRLPNTATMNCCQLHFNVIKFLDCKWTMGWTAILLCYADKLNQ